MPSLPPERLPPAALRPQAPLRIRLTWMAALTGGAAGGVALVTGGWQAAVGVCAVLAAAALYAARTWVPQAVASTDLVAALADGRSAEEIAGPPAVVTASRRVADCLEGRQEAEQAYANLREHTHQLLEAAPMGVLVVEEGGRITEGNRALRDLLGLTRSVVGRQPEEVLPVPEVLEAIDEVFRVGITAPRDVVRGDRDLEVTAFAMAAGLIVFVRDVSRDRRVARARTDFVANVSHELRTPIAAILGYAETMLDTPGLDPEAARMAHKVHRNGLRLRQLFDDLMALYRIEARHRELPKEVVPLATLLGNALVSAADAAASKEIAFSLRCEEGLRVYANPQAVAAIVGNLASNACKYTPEGGTVDVHAHMVGDEVWVDVADTGVGIPKEHQDRVFERFYRVDEGRARTVGGTGLGLAIVKHLTAATGAKVSLRSEQGKGSTFTLQLPAQPPTPGGPGWDAGLGAEPKA